MSQIVLKRILLQRISEKTTEFSKALLPRENICQSISKLVFFGFPLILILGKTTIMLIKLT